jgi:hypothetical protein
MEAAFAAKSAEPNKGLGGSSIVLWTPRMAIRIECSGCLLTLAGVVAICVGSGPQLAGAAVRRVASKAVAYQVVGVCSNRRCVFQRLRIPRNAGGGMTTAGVLGPGAPSATLVVGFGPTATSGTRRGPGCCSRRRSGRSSQSGRRGYRGQPRRPERSCRSTSPLR